jgi:hypothetical protein
MSGHRAEGYNGSPDLNSSLTWFINGDLERRSRGRLRPSLAPECLESERVAYSDVMIDSCGGEAESYVEVDLLQGRNFVRAANVKQVAWAAALGEIAGVFDEGVHRFGELAIQQEGRFAGQVATRGLGGPVERDLPAGGPIVGELARPRQLQPRIVAAARLRFRAGGKA